METIKYLNEIRTVSGCAKALVQLTRDLGIKVIYNEKYGLYVLNYSQIDSPKTHPIVTECRSLVVGVDETDSGFYVVSRSFDRFLNLGENGNEDKIDITRMTAYEKLDGSLIGLFYYKGEWLYRTKSMIMPESEMYADTFGNTWKGLIESTLGEFSVVKNNLYSRDYTFIMEITSPINRIVTRYEESKMTLLAVRSNDTGIYLTHTINQGE